MLKKDRLIKDLFTHNKFEKKSSFGTCPLSCNLQLLNEGVISHVVFLFICISRGPIHLNGKNIYTPLGL
jgi:hypothetical protein